MFLVNPRWRPMIRVETLLLCVVMWLVATANDAWWHTVAQGRDWSRSASWLFLVACFVALTMLHFALLAAVANRWIVRPLLTVLVVASAAASYYMRAFAVILDPSMLRNVLSTDLHEARELLTLDMFVWVAAWSALPVAAIWLVRLERLPPWRALLVRVLTITGALLLAVTALLPVSRDFASLMRNHHEARYLVTPANYLYGLGRNIVHDAADAHAPRQPVGTDAHSVRLASATPPLVLVLVVGETARASNFSLLGYARPTNPELARLDVIAFSRVESCGTSTEVSVPCMFSHYGREHYDERRIRGSETLLDVLVRAGYRVKWLDNQSGCKGVCKGAGIEYAKLDAKIDPQLCAGGECHDELLAVQLERELELVRSNTVFVLHMMGNHGPAYFLRYPPQFRRFVPDCASAELRDCSREQIVNAYDNAILYTDHVLARVVRALAMRPGLDSAMLYVSDHGESLGEKGLYLHGIPYAIAPEQQTHVPMIVWLSRARTQSGDVNARCVQAKADAPLSHDNLFHSVLGLLDVGTAVYREERDLFDGCRGAFHAVVQSKH